MRGTGDKPPIDVLAMAKGKSPWGGGKRGGDSATDEADPPPADAGEPKEPEPAAEAPPRNPWLPPAEDGEARRSARIEDILRQRRGAAGGGGLPGLPGGGRARTVLPWVLAGTALALALSTALHVIEPGQSGLVTTLGRYSRSLGPGTHLTLPWPLEAVALRGGKGAEPVALPGGDGEMLLLTRDGELIDLAFQLRWRVSDPRLFSGAFADPDATLRSLALAEMRAAVAELRFEDILDGASESELQSRVTGRIQRALDAMRSGVRVEGVEVIRTQPPSRLAEAFKKQKAAREDADRDRKQAEDWAAQTRANARIEADAFNKVYEQYRLAPQVMRSKMYYEMMEGVLHNNAQVVAGGAAGSLPRAPAAKGKQ